MKISKLIKRLGEMQAQYGDILIGKFDSRRPEKLTSVPLAGWVIAEIQPENLDDAGESKKPAKALLFLDSNELDTVGPLVTQREAVNAG